MAIFVFPGQGAQFTGMGMDLYASSFAEESGIRNLFDRASGLWGSDIKTLLTSDAEVLKQTDVSQIAITVVSLAVVKALAWKGIVPSACAGFSLGEYPALVVAGVLSEEDALRLVIERGRIMQEVATQIAATAGDAPGMAAVLGLSSEAVDSVIASLGISGLYAANYNSPVQTVVSGTAEALAASEAAFKEAGARRVVRLKVAGPFHSPLMGEAGNRFAATLEPVEFRDPVLPLFSNVTGSRVTSGAEAKKCAVSHISSPVRWTQEEAQLASLITAQNGVDGLTGVDLIEAGPGKVLSGLWADSKQPGICKPWAEVVSLD